jgi:hypothetical protein
MNKITIYGIIYSVIIGILTNNWKLIVVIAVFLVLYNLFIYNAKKLQVNEPIKCREKTLDNPMGNILYYTKDEEMDYKVCDNNKELLDYNFYYDSNDLYKTKISKRQFITMPSQQFPNDIDKFKKYVYYFDNPTCKMDNNNCMFNEDIRYHKTDFLDKNQ